MTMHISRRSALGALAAAGIAPFLGMAPEVAEAGGKQKPRRERWTQQTIFANGPGSAPDELNDPYRMDVTANGLKVLIADTDNDRVTVWTRPSLNANEITDWTVQTTFGCEPNDGDARFVAPQGVAVSANGLLAWVADTGNNRVSLWGYNSGSWQNEYILDVDGSIPYFSEPIDVAMTPDNTALFVLDAGTSEVVVFFQNGDGWHYLTRFGGYGSGQGQFISPSGISITDDAKYVFVADAGNHRVSVWEIFYAPEPLATRALLGDFNYGTTWSPMTRLATPGGGRNQLALPAGVSNSSDGKKVFIADMLNNRISVWKWRSKRGTWRQWYTIGVGVAGEGANEGPMDVVVTPQAQTLFMPLPNSPSPDANRVQVFIGQPTRRRRRWRVYHGRRKPGLH